MDFSTKCNCYLSIEPKTYRSLVFGGMLGLLGFSGCSRVNAQISGDNTMSTEVNSSDSLTEISGGTTKGNNLFHSFQEFSITSGNTVKFNNAEDIGNIIGRVTGGSVSKIDGAIEAGGEANLILINPTGIDFGVNARLDIGGSFLGSTASSLVFADGTVFSATEPGNSLLTLSVPIGLQLGQNSGAINVAGKGHDRSVESSMSGNLSSAEVAGLKVKAGETLALVGNDLTLTGGTLTAESGAIELGSVAQGIVGLTPDNWRLDYSDVSLFGEIELTQQSLADVSGIGSGSVALEGDRVLIQDGSAIIAQNFGDRLPGNISVNATESLTILGTESTGEIASGLYSETISAANAGSISVATKNLTALNGGNISSLTTGSQGTGAGGNINIVASESVKLVGVNPTTFAPSQIAASSDSFGDAGNITIDTSELIIQDSAGINVSATATGDAGDLSINADSIALSSYGGINAVIQEGAGGAIDLEVTNALSLSNRGQIISDNFGGQVAGDISISSNSLSIGDRSYISSTSFGSGRGGNVILNIAESVSIIGTGYEEFQQTFQVSALDGSLEPRTRNTGIFIGTTNDGMSGNLQLNTNSVSLESGGIIFNPVFAAGIGGNIEINANNLALDGSGIQTSAGTDSTSSAEAGNIIIDTARLIVQDGGTIVNATFGDATGGNIDIDATESVVLEDTPENSLIFTGIYAKTITGQGNGGDINLATDRLKIDNALISSNTGIFIHNGLTFEQGGNGGNISIKVADAIEISGIPVDARFASGISSSTVSNGAAGNIEIFTNKLSIQDGSEIAATTIGSGDGGNLAIEVTESINLIGTTTVNNMQRGGLIAASGRETFPQQQATGASGDITITAKNLTIEGGASIDVQSIDRGSAGNLNIQVDDLISLDDRGTISAETDFGAGGNINIEASNIFWLGNSTTTATASNNADGGNINIKANNLIALESSQLTAEAETGAGGNIIVDADGLFVCPTCRVSASSKLGIDGVVNITTLNLNPDFEAVDLPIQLTQPESAVAMACSSESSSNANSLIVSGRGGLPPRPNEVLNSKAMVDFTASSSPREVESSPTVTNQLPAPARSWYTNSQGRIILTSRLTSPKSASPRRSPPVRTSSTAQTNTVSKFAPGLSCPVKNDRVKQKLN